MEARAGASWRRSRGLLEYKMTGGTARKGNAEVHDCGTVQSHGAAISRSGAPTRGGRPGRGPCPTAFPDERRGGALTAAPRKGREGRRGETRRGEQVRESPSLNRTHETARRRALRMRRTRGSPVRREIRRAACLKVRNDSARIGPSRAPGTPQGRTGRRAA